MPPPRPQAPRERKRPWHRPRRSRTQHPARTAPALRKQRVTAIFRKRPPPPEETLTTPRTPVTPHTHVLARAFGERSWNADAPFRRWTKDRRRPTVEQHHVQPTHLTTLVRPVPATGRGAHAQGRPLPFPRRRGPRRPPPPAVGSLRHVAGRPWPSRFVDGRPSVRSAVEVSHRPHRRTPPVRCPWSGARHPHHGQGWSGDARTCGCARSTATPFPPEPRPKSRHGRKGKSRRPVPAPVPARTERPHARETTAVHPPPRCPGTTRGCGPDTCPRRWTTASPPVPSAGEVVPERPLHRRPGHVHHHCPVFPRARIWKEKGASLPSEGAGCTSDDLMIKET